MAIIENTIKEKILTEIGLLHDIEVRHSDSSKILQYFHIVIDGQHYTLTDEALQNDGLDKSIRMIVYIYNQDREKF